VATRNSGAIADVVAELQEDQPQREALALRARERIQQRFSWDVAAASLETFYRDLIAAQDNPAVSLNPAMSEAG